MAIDGIPAGPCRPRHVGHDPVGRNPCSGAGCFAARGQALHLRSRKPSQRQSRAPAPARSKDDGHVGRRLSRGASARDPAVGFRNHPGRAGEAGRDDGRPRHRDEDACGPVGGDRLQACGHQLSRAVALSLRSFGQCERVRGLDLARAKARTRRDVPGHATGKPDRSGRQRQVQRACQEQDRASRRRP